MGEMIFKNISGKSKKLRIDKRLPQILLPNDKIDMMEDWWNEDIRFQDDIPHAFEEGYFIVGLCPVDIDSEVSRNIIRNVAKINNDPVYIIREIFSKFLESFKEITLYFKFIGSNKVFAEIYGYDDLLMSKVNFEYGSKGECEPVKDFFAGDGKSIDDILENLYYNVICYWATTMWYLATTTTTTKYYYENKSPIVTSRHKKVVNVSSVKTINTPIYDMSKIRFVKTEKLIARRKGWTYSHSFQVHGHYRHYKNGKVIFIKPFIKGKGKEFKAQAIKINPK